MLNPELKLPPRLNYTHSQNQHREKLLVLAVVVYSSRVASECLILLIKAPVI